MTAFQSSHSAFDGFETFYTQTIGPKLERLEIKRKKALIRLFVLAPAIFILGLFLTIIIAGETNSASLAGGVLVFCSFISFCVGIGSFDHVKIDAKNVIVTGVCGFVGLAFSRFIEDDPNISPLAKNGLLPVIHDSAEFDDLIEGEHAGLSVSVIHCKLEQTLAVDTNMRSLTVFDGQLIHVDFRKKFFGRTVVVREKKLLYSEAINDLNRVGLVDPSFERIFEAYGSDQVEARYLLTPDVMEIFVGLEELMKGKNIRFAFMDRSLFVVMDLRQRLKAGSMFTPLTDRTRTQVVINEIAGILKLVEAFANKAKLA